MGLAASRGRVVRPTWPGRLLAGAALVAAAGCAGEPEPRRAGAATATAAAAATATDEIDRRIRFCSSELEKSPRLYPVHVQLAEAYFDKARAMHDPRWLAEARRSAERSIAIVPTYAAFALMARIASHAHRFEDVLRWGRRALPRPTAPADVADPAIVAILVEAHSALGEYDEARALLPPEGTAPADIPTAAALAGWLASQGRHEEAARAYDAAAALARAQEVPKAALWAEAMAAGCLVDAGRPDLARPRLDAARRTAPDDVLVRVHEAECLAAEGRSAEGLAVYEALLEERPPDPEVHARAAALARATGDEERATGHFEAAERGFRRVIDAGEPYTLGALARLYCDADIRLDEAVALAERNLQHRRDRESRELLAGARRKRAAAGASGAARRP